MTEDVFARVRALVKALREEGAERSELGPFFEAAKTLEGWLAVPGRNRAKPREVVASFAAWAKVATEEARADRADARREAVRSARWRCVFRVAEAFELDPFGRTAEEAEGQAPEPVAEPVAAGLDPIEPAAEPVAIEPVAVGRGLDTAEAEDAFDAEVDRWLAEAAEALRGDGGDATE